MIQILVYLTKIHLKNAVLRFKALQPCIVGAHKLQWATKGAIYF